MDGLHLATADLDVGSLRTYPGNARRSDVEGIAESLRRNGQYRAIVVQADDRDEPELGGVILAGNHTFLAATEQLGWQSIRCELITCTEDEARRIVLADNRLSDKARFDDDALAALLRKAEPFGLQGTGYTDDDLAKLLSDNLPDPEEATEDETDSVFGVTVDCEDETQQANLLRQLSDDGWKVRALIR